MSEGKCQVDVVVVGSCNMDLISYVSRFPKPGETIHGKRFSTGFGGKGANQCIMASRLGTKTAMVGKVGDDSYGRDTIKNFKDNNVITGDETNYHFLGDQDVCAIFPQLHPDHLGNDNLPITFTNDFLYITKDASTGVAPILVEDSGQNSIVIVSGANFEITPADVEQALSQMVSPKVLLCQLEILHDTVLAALKQARELGITTIFNPAPGVPCLPDEFYQYSDFFCPNETETELLTGLPVTSIEEAEKASLVLLDKGCKTAIITLGGEGAVYACAETRTPRHIPVKPVTPVDTTGAGDAFIGSLAFYLASYPSLELGEMIKRSCEIASISVLSPGTQTSYPWKESLPSQLF